jgi:hypothetical protein
MKLTKPPPLGPVLTLTELLYANAITAPKMTVLNVGRFAGSGVGHVPERPTGFCSRRVPKRPKSKAGR